MKYTREVVSSADRTVREHLVRHEFGRGLIYEIVRDDEEPKVTFGDVCCMDNTLRYLDTIEEMG